MPNTTISIRIGAKILATLNTLTDKYNQTVKDKITVNRYIVMCLEDKVLKSKIKHIYSMREID